MLASALENSEFLISPNFPHSGAQKSVLIKYKENSIKIAKHAVLAVTKKNNQQINESIFKWIIQSCGYALRINDQQGSNSFFQQAAALHLNWLIKFPFPCKNELKENYIKIIMLHLSQIFVNPSFDETICSMFIQKIKLAFFRNICLFSSDTWLVILKVLFYGNSEILSSTTFKIKDSTKLEFAKTSLEVLHKCDVNPDEPFWFQFDQELKDLFKYPIFCQAWITKFSELYIARLQKQNAPHITEDQLVYINYVIQFYRKKIDSEFNENDKQSAFATLVYSWRLFTNENSMVLHKKWDVNEIKEMILPWFSPRVEWHRDDKMNDTHPLFLLIKMSESLFVDQKDETLNKLGSSIIRKALNGPTKNDLFWYFPEYSYFFLIKNPDLLDEIKDDFLKYVNILRGSEFSKNAKLNVYVCLIIMLLIKRNEKEPDVVKSLTEMLITKINDFSVFLVTLVCLLLVKNSELFWLIYNTGLNIHEFDDVIDVISLISFFSPHLNGSDFVNKIVINGNIWNFLYAPISLEFRERIILSFFLLSEGSDYFVVNPDDGATLIQYFIAKDSDAVKFPSLMNFFKMTRLSILCGGALNPAKNLNGDLADQGSIENFITKSYVVSVLDNNHLLIRHGLGTTVFEVNDALNPVSDAPSNEGIQFDSGAFGNDDTDDEVPSADASSSEYISKCESKTELLEAVERMDSLFVSSSDFEVYSPPKVKENVSAAHAFLCDTGFISSFSEKNVRRVSLSTMTNAIENRLDKCESRPVIRIPVLQVDEKSVVYSKKTESLDKLIEKDLSQVSNKVFQIEFVKLIEINKLKSIVEKLGICILLNDTGLHLNHNTTEIRANLIIALVPDKDNYIVDLKFSNIFQVNKILFANHNFDDISFIIESSKLSKFICVVALIFFNANMAAPQNEQAAQIEYEKESDKVRKVSNQNDDSWDLQVMGPELFVSGFQKRSKMILNEFETTNQGKMPLLLEISQETSLEK